jgi:bifunctional non-homologous end joining protein LigD
VTRQKSKADFIQPMLLLRTERLQEGPNWLYELKLDGYRVIGAKAERRAHLWSRNERDFGPRYPSIVNALANLPEHTVVDGEIIALDEAGKPSFSALQNYSSSQAPLAYYIFDLLVLAGRDLSADRGAPPRPVRRCAIAASGIRRRGSAN